MSTVEHFIVEADPAANVANTACGQSIPLLPIPTTDRRCPTCEVAVETEGLS